MPAIGIDLGTTNSAVAYMVAGKPEVIANAEGFGTVISECGSAYTWAMQSANDYKAVERQDWGIERNPVLEIPRDDEASNTRDRNLAAGEIRTVWEAATDGNGGFSLEIESLIKLMICCGQRVQETLRLEGKEIDLDAEVWRMPAHKTKLRKYRAEQADLAKTAMAPES